MSMCLPSFELIVRHLKRVIRNGNNIKSVFVASDSNHMLDKLGEALARMKVNLYICHIIIMLLMIILSHYHIFIYVDTSISTRTAGITSFGFSNSWKSQLFHRKLHFFFLRYCSQRKRSQGISNIFLGLP